MGTDIYLKHPAIDEDEQATGFSIEAGDKGYLRASISMNSENSTLRKIFDTSTKNKDMWDEFEDGGHPFNFRGKYQQCQKAIASYLMARLMGDELTEGTEQHQKMKEQVFGALGDMVEDSEKDAIMKAGGSKQSLPDSVKWANSVIEFYELGLRLQKKYEDEESDVEEMPKVTISW